MNKTVKKLDNNVVKALTKVCEALKDENAHFQWLTHTANYANFPASLLVYCVFERREHVDAFCSSVHKDLLVKRMHGELLRVGVLLKQTKNHILFDSEEACAQEHQGNWNLRLSRQA